MKTSATIAALALLLMGCSGNQASEYAQEYADYYGGAASEYEAILQEDDCATLVALLDEKITLQLAADVDGVADEEGMTAALAKSIEGPQSSELVDDLEVCEGQSYDQIVESEQYEQALSRTD